MDVPRLRQIALLAAIGTVTIGAPAGRAASAAGPSCTGGQVSAIDQYCETIPSSGGAGAPRAGTPSVATTLPPDVVRRLAASPQRALLTLPAGAHKAVHRRARSHTAAAPVKVAAASVWSLSAPMIAVLAAAALVVSGLAVARRRRSA